MRPTGTQHPVIQVLQRRTTLYIVIIVIAVVFAAAIFVVLWRAVMNHETIRKQQSHLISLQSSLAAMQKCVTCPDAAVPAGAMVA